MKRKLPSEERPLEKMGKKLVAARELPAGHVLAPGDLVAKSPADGGLPPYELDGLARADARAAARRGAGGRSRRTSCPPRSPSPRAKRDRSREIRLVVFDFDGVFSDNRVWTNERGEESVACWRGDSLGLRRLDEVGVDYFVITQEANEAVPARARKIRIECIGGIEDKLPVLRERASSGAGCRSPRPRTSATT